MEKANIYCLVNKLIRLMIVLSISTTTTKRVLLIMNIIKTRFLNKVEDDFLARKDVTFNILWSKKIFILDTGQLQHHKLDLPYYPNIFKISIISTLFKN
jgi:hypothetical protein